jgi:hypothetical protein
MFVVNGGFLGVFLLLLFFLFETGLLSVAQTGLIFWNSHASASQVLRLKAYATTLGIEYIFRSTGFNSSILGNHISFKMVSALIIFDI